MPVRFTMVVCDAGVNGDLDNKIKNTLDGLWVGPQDPLAGQLPLYDDDAVEQIVVARLDVGQQYNLSNVPPLLYKTFTAAALNGSPAVYLRLDSPTRMGSFLI